MILAISGIFVVYLLVRIVYWFYYSEGMDFGSDGYYSLLCIREYKKNGHKRIVQIPNMVIPHTNGYPSLGIWLLSFFSEKFIFQFGGLMNSIFDLFYLAAILVTGIFLKLDISALMAMGVTFITLPSLFNKNPINSMHFSITWRDFGRLGASCFFLSLFFCIKYPTHIEFYGVALLFFLACFYGSQFGMQSVMFGSVIFSALCLNAIPVLIMLGGHLLVIIFDWKHIARYYRYKYLHFKIFFKLFRFTHDQLTNDYAFSFIHLKRFASHIFHRQFAYAQSVAIMDPFLRGFYLLPMQLTVAVQLYLMHSVSSDLLLKWYLTSVILWFLTLTPLLKIFGEPDRYLEFFGYLPILLGLGYTFDFTYTEYPWLLAITLLLIAFQLHFVVLDFFSARNYKKKYNAGMSFNTILSYRETGSFLKGKNVFPISLSFAWKIAYIFDCSTVYPPEEDVKESAFICSYPYPNMQNLNAICSKYRIDYFVLAKDHYNFADKKELMEITQKPVTVDRFLSLQVERQALQKTFST